jgi:hypothetical protein
MKRFANISAVFSFLLIFIGVTVSVGSFNINKKNNTYTQFCTFQTTTTQYSQGPQPGSTIYQIRHRSAEKIKAIRLLPSLQIIHELTNPDSPPEYFSKWNTYFRFISISLPHDPNTPSSLSLRSPPVIC